MVAGLAKAGVIHDANIRMFHSLSMVIISALIAISLAWFLGNLVFVRPIERLVNAACRFGEGELGTRTCLIHTKDEIGQLAKSFDDMALLLEMRNNERLRAEQELQKAREELEVKVKERTAELAKANEILRQEISDRKTSEEEKEKLKEQLYQAQKMEAVGRLAGGVAHDFNNMLGVILGYAEMLKADRSLGDRAFRAAAEIERAGIRSRDITRQLLAFSRKQVTAPRPTDLNVSIENAQKTIARLIGEDIELRFIPQEELYIIEIDPSQIDQILIDLALNARDAMPHGGRLTIRTANTTLDDGFCRIHIGVTPGRYVVLEVIDDGIGMDKEVLSHIFEPFFTTKELGKGTGLGLPMVYGIVKQNGGCVFAYSEPQRGTTIKIYLPRFSGEDAEPEEREQDSFVSGAGTILLTEDEALLRHMASAMLIRMGYTVIEARSPSEAISLLEKEDTMIDLLLTDLVMPGMSGKELASRAESLRPGIRVLFMSGYTSDVMVQRGILEEGVHFIEKPFSMEGLSKKITGLIGKSQISDTDGH